MVHMLQSWCSIWEDWENSSFIKLSLFRILQDGLGARTYSDDIGRKVVEKQPKSGP